MDAVYKFLDSVDGLSLVDTALLILIYGLVRSRFNGLIGDLKCARERITRLERAILGAGVKLGNLERE